MDEEEVTPEPTPKWVLEADRAHKRYEIARDVLAGWNEKMHSLMPPAYSVADMAEMSVMAADALLAALEGE
jgi:hypothetical protein